MVSKRRWQPKRGRDGVDMMGLETEEEMEEEEDSEKTQALRMQWH